MLYLMYTCMYMVTSVMPNILIHVHALYLARYTYMCHAMPDIQMPMLFYARFRQTHAHYTLCLTYT